jgi:hypothetical protein
MRRIREQASRIKDAVWIELTAQALMNGRKP